MEMLRSDFLIKVVKMLLLLKAKDDTSPQVVVVVVDVVVVQLCLWFRMVLILLLSRYRLVVFAYVVVICCCCCSCLQRSGNFERSFETIFKKRLLSKINNFCGCCCCCCCLWQKLFPSKFFRMEFSMFKIQQLFCQKRVRFSHK